MLTAETERAIICAIMGDMLIRNVPRATVEKLKRRAKRHGRSLQAEVLALLQEEASYSGDAFVDALEELRADGKLNFDTRAALAALRDDRAR